MREVQLKPTEATYKVAVISGADRLNPQAANAFLKTLEEPPDLRILERMLEEMERMEDWARFWEKNKFQEIYFL